MRKDAFLVGVTLGSFVFVSDPYEHEKYVWTSDYICSHLFRMRRMIFWL